MSACAAHSDTRPDRSLEPALGSRRTLPAGPTVLATGSASASLSSRDSSTQMCATGQDGDEDCETVLASRDHDGDEAEEDYDGGVEDNDEAPIISQATSDNEDEDTLDSRTESPTSRKRKREDLGDDDGGRADREAKERRITKIEHQRLEAFWAEACSSQKKRSHMKYLISVLRAFNQWYIKYGSRNSFSVDDAGVVKKRAPWSSRSYAEEYTETSVPHDVLDKLKEPCGELTYSDMIILEMLYRDPDHLVEWKRFVTEPLESIDHLDPWKIPNRISMFDHDGPVLYVFGKHPYIGSSEATKNRASQHKTRTNAGNGINEVVKRRYKGRKFEDGPEAVLYPPPHDIDRTSLYTLESKGISAYGGLVEFGGSNINLFDRQTFREVVTRQELEVGLVKIFDELVPKDPATGSRKKLASLPSSPSFGDLTSMAEWDKLREVSGLALASSSFPHLFDGSRRKNTMLRLIKREGIPLGLWRTGQLPPKLANRGRFGKKPASQVAAESAERHPYGPEVNIPSAARAGERAAESHARLRDAGPRDIHRNASHPSTEEAASFLAQVNSLDSASAGSSSRVLSSRDHAKTKPSLFDPRHYGTSTGWRNKSGSDTSSGF